MAIAVVLTALACAACGSSYSASELAARQREVIGAQAQRTGESPTRGADGNRPEDPDDAGQPGDTTLSRPSGSDGRSGTELGSDRSSDGSSALGGAPTGTGDEIVVATVGNYSGIPGIVYRDAPKAIQAWAQATNEHGGISGHPVRAIVRDDGSDPSKHVAIIRELVEKQGVVAFVAHYAPLSGAAGLDYLNSKEIPVVGGEVAETWWTTPMFFPQTAAGEHQFHRQVFSVRQMLEQESKTNVGILVCAEAASCSAASAHWRRFAPDVGVKIVYDAAASVAQPDYTSECLAMQRARVDLVLTSLDGNSIRRLAGSCTRQGYAPIIWLQGGAAQTQMRDDPNLDGLRATDNSYPYFLSGTPGAKAMHAALDARIGDVDTFNVVTNAYASAKLLEQAIAGVSGPVTSKAIIAALHTFRDESLGGLIVPVSYPAGADDAKQPFCWFQNGIDRGRWFSPTKGALSCA